MPRSRVHSTASLQFKNLQARLAELEETLDAIRTGAVDALVVPGPNGEQIFSLKGADQAYRVLVEAMNEGAVTVDAAGVILYGNARFAGMAGIPLERVLGAPLLSLIDPHERKAAAAFLRKARRQRTTFETCLMSGAHSALDVLLSANPLPESEVGALCLVVTDISQRKTAEEAQRQLSKNIIGAQEQERQRVARELHDGVTQLLSSTKHRLHDLEARLPRHLGSFRKTIQQVRLLLERSIAEVRAISRNLRPSELDDLGLIPAIRSLGEEFAERTGLDFIFRPPACPPALPPQAELIIYRIVQEALTNVEKHAAASRVAVRLDAQDKRLQLKIRDNGNGLPVRRQSKPGWGLVNMRERASYVHGKIELESQPGRGTVIKVEIPL